MEYYHQASTVMTIENYKNGKLEGLQVFLSER
jgi:antitoxin component YwqK of YwqJK toxin-antitoxin module